MQEIVDIPTQQIGLLLTYRCNLNCKYCYIKSKQNKEMSYELAISILEKYLSQKDGFLDITFYGGETLLAFDTIKKVVDWALSYDSKRKFRFFGCTNGTLLTEEHKNWLRQHSDVFVLGLSYDGLPKTQTTNRSDKGIDIDFFIKTWPQQPIQMTINEESVCDMADGVIYLLNKGAKVNPNVAYEEYEWSDYSIKQYEVQLIKLLKYYESNSTFPLVGQFTYDLNAIAHNIDNPTKARRVCGAGDGFILYDINGEGYPCHLLSPLVLNKNQLEKLTKSFNIQTTDFTDKRCDKCPLSLVCSTCMACNFIYRENFGRRDSTHCRITKADVKATVRKEVNRLLNLETLTSVDAMLIDSINKIVSYSTI